MTASVVEVAAAASAHMLKVDRRMVVDSVVEASCRSFGSHSHCIPSVAGVARTAYEGVV